MTGNYWDDISGTALEAQDVWNDRAEEMGEVHKHNVYNKVPLAKCWEMTGKRPTGVRWLDVNKGDLKNPEIRCRVVAQEIQRDKREDSFAATLPVEAMKVLFAASVTRNLHRRPGRAAAEKEETS